MICETTGLAKVKASTAAEVCARFDLKKKARQLLGEGMGPREFVQALLANKEYIAGIDFMAHALPAREAVWWGCLCVQHAYGGDLCSPEKEACAAAVQWVIQPTEEHRAAAQFSAQAAGRASATGQLAIAVHQTGENVAPPNAPAKPPAPFAPAKAVALAVNLAANKADPVKIADTQRSFLELGIGVAEGRFR
jgi:hypothetical protein